MNQLNISMFLQRAAREAPDKVFIRDGEKHITFSRAETDACRIANVFERLGVKKGDRIALWLPNSVIYPVAHFAALKLGAVPVPLHAGLQRPELRAFLEDSEPVLLLADGPLVSVAEETVRGLDCCRHVLVVGPYAGKAGGDDVSHLETMMGEMQETIPLKATEASDPAAILYTSGTVGMPKGAVLSHLNYYFFTQTLVHDFWKIQSSDVILMIAPPSNIFGQTILSVACCAQAEVTVLNGLTPKSLFQTIERDKVTFIAGVPVLGQLISNVASTGRFNFSSLKKMMFGGSSMPSGLAARLKPLLPVDIISGYGMTEGVPLTFYSEKMVNAPSQSVGLAALGTEIRIVDENDKDVPNGDCGEIIARGPQVFLGYLNHPEENERVFRGGWLHTGDVGRRDEAGFLYIVDRVDDVIKTKGYKIYPSEVESILLSHPSVADAAVVGFSDATRGYEVKAFLVRKEDTAVDSRELMDFCKSSLAEYKCPRRFVFVDTLPKNANGKVLKRMLRDRS